MLQKIHAFADLIAFLKKERPDVLVSWLWPAVITGNLIARLSGIPLRVANIRGPALTKSSVKVFLDRLLATRYTRYIAVSESVRTLFSKREKYPAARWTTIPNGLSLAAVPKYTQREARRKIGIAAGTYLITAIGRLYPEKNQELLLSAVQYMVKTLKFKKPFKVLLVGDGPQEQYLQKKIRDLKLQKYCQLTGWQEDVYRYIAAADVCVLPSQYEGHPSAVLQAWALQKPLVGTKVMGIRDIIVDGYNGLLCSVKDSRELANILVNFAAYPETAKKFGINGYRTLRQEYTLEKMETAYLDFFASILK